MAKGLFIIGTDTGVGKTVVSAGLMYLLLKENYNAGYFKPIASGEIELESRFVPADARFVKTTSGYTEEDETITPVSFRPAVSPHLAAKKENRTIDFEGIRDMLRILKQKYEFILIEGCGGLAVPLTDQGYMLYHFIQELGLDCLLISRAGLGAINHTLLTLQFAENLGINVAGVFMNGYGGTEIERDNLDTLRKFTRHPFIVPVSNLEGIDVENLKIGNIKECFESQIDIHRIAGLMKPF
jgi:dethiobiotin synthetase